MKYEYCKICWYFRKFIIILDIKNDSEVPLFNRKNSKCNGNNIPRKMVYNCDFNCSEISKIKYCFKRTDIKRVLNKEFYFSDNCKNIMEVYLNGYNSELK